MIEPTAIASDASEFLHDAADPAKAEAMAKYMKSEMPFYGVPAPARKGIVRRLVSSYPPGSRQEYEAIVRALWRGDHREERYLAIGYARAFPRYVTLTSVPLYRAMITRGAWWDVVDETAVHLVGHVLERQRASLTTTMDSWTTSEDMWLRRTSIISQLAHKADTDTELLDHACTRNLADSEFFVRKAIAWALRQYAKTDPDWVGMYVKMHETQMSGLTRREATKHLEMECPAEVRAGEALAAQLPGSPNSES
jgi:3-methyladenine DNA glycosylase AlkD